MKQTKIKNIMCIMAAFVLSLFAVFESALSISVKAEDSITTEESIYTDVLDDLQKDETFNVDDYPVNTLVDEMTVIQIAESSNKELFVYVYQPNTVNNYTLSEIRMGFPKANVLTTYKDYELTLLSENSVFQKYLVEGVTVSADWPRKYELILLARPNNVTNSPDIASLATDNTINNVVYEVAQTWTIYELNGVTYTDMTKTDVIIIENLWAGSVRYSGGFHLLWNENVDSHFVVFNTDKQMEFLEEVDFSYYAQSHTHKTDTTKYPYSWHEYGENVFSEVQTIKGKDKGVYEGTGFGAHQWEWNRIETAQSFLDNERTALSDEAITNIQNVINSGENTAWILRFTETQYEKRNNIGVNAEGYPAVVGEIIDSTFISKLTILRLQFTTDGVPYNLGVVANKVTSDNIADGGHGAVEGFEKEFDEFMENATSMFKVLLGVFGIALVGVILATVVGLCVPFIRPIFKGIWWLISFPFRLIGKLFKKK